LKAVCASTHFLHRIIGMLRSQCETRSRDITNRTMVVTQVTAGRNAGFEAPQRLTRSHSQTPWVLSKATPRNALLVCPQHPCTFVHLVLHKSSTARCRRHPTAAQGRASSGKENEYHPLLYRIRTTSLVSTFPAAAQ